MSLKNYFVRVSKPHTYLDRIIERLSTTQEMRINEHGTFTEIGDIVDKSMPRDEYVDKMLVMTDQLRELKIGLDLSTNEMNGLARFAQIVFGSEVEAIAPSLEFAGERGDSEATSVGILSIVEYPEWLANVVPVPKKDGKVRVCVDFQDLNKANPKDDFPLPHIDMLVDSTAGHSMLSFMDKFSRYSQILMAPDDIEKTSFITKWSTYCYRVMPFGLEECRSYLSESSDYSIP
ncbi:Transposon Ty3-I Gag-Pol polyprotein [Vitis vinifera]|uniref:Transposon Ty3-I Gag-Pol polyprotein n=1 Tax=Vitis vinifera TaxID=29760 RepID=A0A438DNS9_VITVI|nr:Transposon Ty3-I Gag-Pol polyprotein [Vitis vinifera]